MSKADDHAYYSGRALAAQRMAAAASSPSIAAIHERMAREYAARVRCADPAPKQYVRQLV